MIAMYGCAKGTNTIVRLDDPTIATDEGAAMPTPFFVTAPIDFGPGGMAGKLRRAVQVVALAANASVTVTPVANGSDLTDQALTEAFDTVDGPEQWHESYPDAPGTRFQLRVEVTSPGIGLEFGEADLSVIPQRSTVNV